MRLYTSGSLIDSGVVGRNLCHQQRLRARLNWERPESVSSAFSKEQKGHGYYLVGGTTWEATRLGWDETFGSPNSEVSPSIIATPMSYLVFRVTKVRLLL